MPVRVIGSNLYSRTPSPAPFNPVVVRTATHYERLVPPERKRDRGHGGASGVHGGGDEDAAGDDKAPQWQPYRPLGSMDSVLNLRAMRIGPNGRRRKLQLSTRTNAAAQRRAPRALQKRDATSGSRPPSSFADTGVSGGDGEHDVDSAAGGSRPPSSRRVDTASFLETPPTTQEGERAQQALADLQYAHEGARGRRLLQRASNMTASTAKLLGLPSLSEELHASVSASAAASGSTEETRPAASVPHQSGRRHHDRAFGALQERIKQGDSLVRRMRAGESLSAYVAPHSPIETAMWSTKHVAERDVEALEESLRALQSKKQETATSHVPDAVRLSKRVGALQEQLSTLDSAFRRRAPGQIAIHLNGNVRGVGQGFQSTDGGETDAEAEEKAALFKQLRRGSWRRRGVRRRAAAAAPGAKSSHSTSISPREMQQDIEVLEQCVTESVEQLYATCTDFHHTQAAWHEQLERVLGERDFDRPDRLKRTLAAFSSCTDNHAHGSHRSHRSPRSPRSPRPDAQSQMQVTRKVAHQRLLAQQTQHLTANTWFVSVLERVAETHRDPLREPSVLRLLVALLKVVEGGWELTREVFLSIVLFAVETDDHRLPVVQRVTSLIREEVLKIPPEEYLAWLRENGLPPSQALLGSVEARRVAKQRSDSFVRQMEKRRESLTAMDQEALQALQAQVSGTGDVPRP